MAQKQNLDTMLNLISTFDNKCQREITLHLTEFENIIEEEKKKKNRSR